MVVESTEMAVRVVYRVKRVLDVQMEVLERRSKSHLDPSRWTVLYAAHGGARCKPGTTMLTYPSSSFCFFDSCLFASLILQVSS
jgi:hypothetical protein